MGYSENAWEKYSEEDMKKVFALSDDYKKFMTKCKTERECVKEVINIAEQNGYKDLDQIITSNQKLNVGDKVYRVNKGKSIALFIIGKKPIDEGMNILGAHIDSPRLDLKQNPLYEDTDLAL